MCIINLVKWNVYLNNSLTGEKKLVGEFDTEENFNAFWHLLEYMEKNETEFYTAEIIEENDGQKSIFLEISEKD